jgi:RNA methyltransferase, TrmH family
MELITSRTNPKIKFVRALRQRKAREESGVFLVEGIRHVGEAVQAARDRSHPGPQPQIEQILYAPQLLTSDFARQLVAEEEARGVPCYPTSPEVFAALAEKENPQGLIAVVRQPSLALSDLDPQRFPWGVALVQPQDPGNLGSILRTIDAVGASGLILLDSSVDAYHPSAVRASMGTIFWYPVVSASFEAFASWARQHGYHVFGTSARGAVDYREVPAYPVPRLLLMGSEREGLSARHMEVCELLVRLPMLGRASSLNLGVATGVFLYAMLGAKLQLLNPS